MYSGETVFVANPGAILFQLPSGLPLARRHTRDEGLTDGDAKRHLPDGKIGKLQIYKSGKVCLKMGEVVLDVSCGTPWLFHQQLVAINVREEDGHCVFLGDVKKRALCTVNVSQLLQNDSDSEHPAKEQKTKEVDQEDLMDGQDVAETMMVPEHQDTVLRQTSVEPGAMAFESKAAR